MRSIHLFRSVVCIILTLALILPISVYAIEGSEEADKESDKRTVRVGWYASDLFQEGSEEDEQKSGYAYDYLRKLADYASWKYEYVYGEWSELYEKLCNGEIDFMAGVSKTDERENLMLFPSTAMGTDRYYLYKHDDDSTISMNDVSSFNGKKIGVLSNNRMSEFTLNWLKSNNIDAEVMYYDGFDSLDAAFEKGEIDLAPRTLDSASNYDSITAVVSLGDEPYYLAVNKQKPDLLAELNEAINCMNSVDPYSLQNMQYNNYGKAYAGRTLTDEERVWLEEHPTIKVGYFGDYLPYCAADSDGEATGLMTDVIKAAFEALELDTVPTIEYVSYRSYDGIVSALALGEIDLGFPISDSTWTLEQEGISASSEVISDRGALFYKTVFSQDEVKTIAINVGNFFQTEYIELSYPDAELVYYPTIGGCLDAVLKGEADATVMDSLRIGYVTGQSKYDELSYIQLSNATAKCFGVKQGNRDLLMLINRGLKLLGSSYGYDRAYKYVELFDNHNALDYLKRHKFEIAVTLFLVTVLVIALLTLYIRHQRNEMKIKEDLKRRAENANAAKSMFLFNMSHDIRTPMNAVLGFNELMLNDIDKPEKLKEYIEKVKFSGEYLLGLINNVLEVARIDSGRESLDEDFADLMDDSYYIIFENQVRAKQLNVIKNVDVEHRYVYTDAHKIREIFLNIISNAIKYTPEGGTIRLNLTENPCDIEGYGNYVCAISDTGIGMTEEFQEHVFDTFARESNSTESGILGTGLGMNIVKKLTELMGGTVTVESKPGVGSTFTVSMNLRIVENPEEFLDDAQGAGSASKINLKGKRILVAEDNELNAEITTAILESFGAAVCVAKDGVVCVDMMQSHEAGYYCMILMDIQMPNLDGYNATRKIRAFSDRGKASIPIAAMTANAFDEDKKAAIEAGMNGHIAKPIDVEKLVSTIKKLLR